MTEATSTADSLSSGDGYEWCNCYEDDIVVHTASSERRGWGTFQSRQAYESLSDLSVGDTQFCRKEKKTQQISQQNKYNNSGDEWGFFVDSMER